MNRPQAIVDTARQLLFAGGALQSVDGVERIDPAKVKDALVRHLEQIKPADTLAVESAAAQVMKTAEAALQRTAPGDDATLRDFEFDCLEVIVQVLGRPALRLPRGRVEPPTTDLAGNERWTILVSRARDHINCVSSSVARLNLRRTDGREEHLGTAWRLGSDLLVTNRHVMHKLVADLSLEPAQWALDPARVCIADFSVTDAPAGSVRLEVASLAYCAPEAAIDVAVLRLRPTGHEVPAALQVSFEKNRLGAYDAAAVPTFIGRQVYVVGHPQLRLPTPESLKVFGDADGRKRCSPGETTGVLESATVVRHDCSTLGGSSGSAVFDAYEHCVVGIHMGGHGPDPSSPVGTSNDAVAIALLCGHRLGTVLKTGVVQTP